jgi:hypothetical protein
MWNGDAPSEPTIPAFEVKHYTIARHGTMTDSEYSEALDDDLTDSVGPNQEPLGSGATPTHSTPPGSPVAQAFEFTTPPTGESVNSEGAPMRFKTLDNVYDTSEEVTDFEYSGFCATWQQKNQAVWRML